MNLTRTMLFVPALALSLAAFSLSPSPAVAQSKCTSAAKVTTAIWEKYGAELKKAGCKKGGDKCSKMEAIVKEMVRFWNEQAGNGWATIGPRQVVFEGKLDGKIVAGGERIFVTTHPVVDADKITVEVKKEDGKAPATVSLSLVGDDNKCVEGDEVNFAGDAKKGATKKLSVSGARDRMVVIKVDAKDGKAFDYELVVRKE